MNEKINFIVILLLLCIFIFRWYSSLIYSYRLSLILSENTWKVSVFQVYFMVYFILKLSVKDLSHVL